MSPEKVNGTDVTLDAGAQTPMNVEYHWDVGLSRQC